LPVTFQGGVRKGRRRLPSVPGHRKLFAPEQMELSVHGLQGKDIAAKQHDNGEFQAVHYDLVQDHIPVEHYQERVLQLGDTAPAWGKTL